jgi:hypothetical protein
MSMTICEKSRVSEKKRKENKKGSPDEKRRNGMRKEERDRLITERKKRK